MAQKTSTNAVIDALGGTGAVAALTGTTLPAVSNWRSFGAFPANTYLVLTSALEAKGHDAPTSLWGMKERAPAEPAPQHEGQS